ncbi:MAG: LysM peptidoglycan-binding domain-containing protein [Planctomycetota bacterium]
MQPIERYGLIALIFLAITIAAACLWEPDEDGSKGAGVAGVAAKSAEVKKKLQQKQPDASRDFVSARSKPREGRPLNAKQAADLVAQREQEAARNEPRARGDEIRSKGQGRGEEMRRKAEQQRAAKNGQGQPAGKQGGQKTAKHGGGAQGGKQSKPKEHKQDAGSHIGERAQDVLTTALGKARDVAGKLRTDPRPAKRTYVVKGGDTLSEIAERELGRSSRYPEIVALNPGLDPLKLREGARIVLPTPGEKATAPKEVTGVGRVAEADRKKAGKGSAKGGGPVYVVRKNDSLWKIAATALGDGGRYPEIVALNPDLNPDRIIEGQRLKMPAGGAVRPKPERKSKPSGEQVARAAAPAKRGKVR